ncbi:allophanate hydrolase [Actinoplanes sp. SE50]|uniref:allophanate hydrolase n=1 Tax=unclassified Actinoplanes TaxID=2626549 RepID=UPI00023EC344|nr:MULTISPECIES: allophanate hydrolase [unclassified Actinoplanes]AEV86994.1 aspartyl-tRNA(Asn)/glutamyl-tRNA (Gln) amidotransferase subunit A [Actinoplanes sp. SE50/110]ATO85390.1 allophanate hydrolase [Actinoplanes sp. SE50]SLM02802.1 allophanate hydrolase [Actinoplanes sp. SE50/110]
MRPTTRVRAAYDRLARNERPEAWITLRPVTDLLADAVVVEARLAAGEELPLAGKLVAVKDNIDVAGLPTTAGCPAYAYRPAVSATAVQRLVDAGALILGKTNLDQFATGLVGTRSPYGAVRDVRDPTRVSGGSSSGSAVVVALGIADLALGTDTAGSGRVPAAFQGIVGMKPTPGLVPTDGVVPACRSFDCVTVFARTLGEGRQALGIISDPMPPSGAAPPHPIVAVPDRCELTALSPDRLDAFEQVTKDLEAAGARLRPIRLAPFLAAAKLLYQGGFVAERYAAVGAFIDEHPAEVDPTVRAIIGAARDIPAHVLVADTERLDRLRAEAMAEWGDADALLLPTAPTHPTSAEVAADPIGVNATLGTYTNFCNLFGLSAVAVPAAFGVQIIARGFADTVAADVAALVLGETPCGGTTGTGLPLLVVGAHLTGQPLNHQLTEPGGRFLRAVRTAAHYRLHALPTDPPKPGLVRVAAGGAAIEGEVWALPPDALGRLLAGLPSPMALGPVRLADGTTVTGFLCEGVAAEGAPDITGHGGWRAYLSSRAGS